MRARRPAQEVVVIFLCVLLAFILDQNEPSASAAASAQTTTAQWRYPAASWALGVVVPEGAGLEGGGQLHWESAGNVTAIVRLPNISHPDMIIYAVLSVMTDDGSVLQAAAGIYPHSGTWLVYSWVVTDVWSVPPTYKWILNSSRPEMAPNASVSISIFLSLSNSWELKVADATTGSSVERAFSSGISPLIKVGDQEVFALESYSRSQGTFEKMGSLALRALLVDGKRVSTGFYFYGGWDSSRNPLFAVGSAGASPPTFVSLQREDDGSIVWNGTSRWQSNSLAYPGLAEAGITILLLVLVISPVLVLIVLALANRRKTAERDDVGRGQAGG